MNESLRPTSDPTGTSEIRLIRQELITGNLLELEFDRDVVYANNTEMYQVSVNGRAIEGFTIACYFDNILSIRLPEAVEKPAEAKITVKIRDRSVRDVDGNDLAGGKIYDVAWNPYYTKFHVSKCGIVIKSCKEVKDETLRYAADAVDIMASKRPEIAAAMARMGADIALYPYTQHIFYIPEERESYDESSLNVEGFGGTDDLPTTALAAANVERDYEHALYPRNNILAHEFGHAFHLIGIRLGDPKLFKEIDDLYQKSVVAGGKWANSYAGTNRDEYFGQLTALWFAGLDEAQEWTGVLGPVNTRDELLEYDPDAYALLEKIYPDDQYFPPPWSKQDEINNYDIHGKPYAV